MSDMDEEYKLSAGQVLTRILSVIIIGVGGSACGFSLMMQVQETGTLLASVTWFSGLSAVVFALAGYAVSCDPGKGRSYIPAAATVALILVVTGSVLSHIYLYAHMMILIALIAAAVEGVVLVIYHFVFKRRDPDAA